MIGCASVLMPEKIYSPSTLVLSAEVAELNAICAADCTTESLMLPSVVGEAVHQSLVTANALGFGEKFVPSLIEVQEKLAGVSIVGRT